MATAASVPPTTATTTAQPRRIDSKTMHALIALGADNMTGPWLVYDVALMAANKYSLLSRFQAAFDKHS